MRKSIPLSTIEKCPECGCPFTAKLTISNMGNTDVYYCPLCKLPYIDTGQYYVAVMSVPEKTCLIDAIKESAVLDQQRGDN